MVMTTLLEAPEREVFQAAATAAAATTAATTATATTAAALAVILGGAAHPLGAPDLSDLAVHPDMVPVSTNFSCATCTFSVSFCC